MPTKAELWSINSKHSYCLFCWTTTTATRFNGLFSRTTWVSQHQKGKTSLDLNEARDDGVLGQQWHQLDHMQAICTSLQTDSHTNTSSLNFYRPDALPDAQPAVSKHWRQFAVLLLLYIWITLVDFPVTVTPGNILRICPLVHVELTLMLCALNCCCSCGWYLLAALSRHYNAKMSFEHQLPTASQKLKVTDECILAAVVSLVTCTSKVSYPAVASHSG